METTKQDIRYIVLEEGIGYDNDDFDVYGAVLYDMDKKCITSTRYGHGTPMKERKESVTLEQAIERGLITERELKKFLIDCTHFPKDMLYDISSSVHINIPCTVSSRCKYVKGDAIMLKWHRLRDYFSRDGYTKVMIVYSPKNNTLSTVGLSSITIDDNVWLDIVKKAKTKMMEEESVSALIHQYAYMMSYYSCDRRNREMVNIRNLCRAFPYTDTPDLSSASFPQMERGVGYYANKSWRQICGL